MAVEIIAKKRKGKTTFSLDLRVNGKRFRRIVRNASERHAFFCEIREVFAKNNCTCRYCGKSFRFPEYQTIASAMRSGSKSPVLCGDCLEFESLGLPSCDMFEAKLSDAGTLPVISPEDVEKLLAYQADESARLQAKYRAIRKISDDFHREIVDACRGMGNLNAFWENGKIVLK